VMTTEAEHRGGGAKLARRFPHGGSLSPPSAPAMLLYPGPLGIRGVKLG
jgi:hypothetical protein